MKRYKLMACLPVFILGFFCAISVPAVFAISSFDVYTVDSTGSTTPKNTFAWNEKPFLYLHLPSTGLQVTKSWWSDPDGNPFYTSSGPNNNQNTWHNISNWDSIKTVGTWKIDAAYSYASRNVEPRTGCTSTSFTVTPEPLSAALILIGGAALTLRRKQKNKKESAMKKIMCLFLLGIFCSMAPAAFATSSGFLDLYTVDSTGSTTPKSTFGWNEKPFLYMHLPSTGLQVTGAWWSSPDTNFYYTASGPETNQQVWHSLNNWNSVKQPGVWNIDADYSYFSPGGKGCSNCGTGSTSFTVTPEPLSASLILIGGASLMWARRRRNNRERN